MKKLRFRLNKELDTQMIEEFLGMRGGGIDFGKGIIKTHPKLKPILSLNAPKKEKAIRAYCDKYYQDNKPAILNKMQLIKRAWQNHESEYRNITEDFFGSFQFPKGEYIAYASIINCNPRFLDIKTFQFFYKKPVPDAIHTIAHELLHFIFFDFVEQKLKKETMVLSQDQLWDLSEIFNVIVLRSTRYQHIIDKRFACPYPNHIKYLTKFEKAYNNSDNAEEFIRRGINIINTKK